MDFDFARELSERRRESLNCEEIKSQEKNGISGKSHQEIYSKYPMTDTELYEWGKILDEEFYKSNDTTVGEGKSGGCFDCWEPEFPEVTGSSRVLRERRKENLEAGQKLKKVYYQCLKLLEDFRFQIYHVEKELSGYKNRRWSACSGENQTFFFYCQKGNYTFTAEFIDDCDCDPGLLIIADSIHVPTENKVDVNCDLYGQNVSSTHIDDFLALLESNDLAEYYLKRFGSLMRIPEELSKRGYRVKMSHEKFSNVHLSNYDYNFIFTVETEKGNCILIPRTEHDRDEYVISVCKLFGAPRSAIKELDINSFNLINRSNRNRKKYFNYCPTNISNIDYDELTKCIESFFSLVTKEYGYFEEGQWYNDVQLRALVKKDQIKWDEFDPYIGPEINVKISLMYGQYEALPFEYYRLHFYYNSHKSDKCQLKVEGKYNDENTVHAICNFSKEGTYLELYEEVKTIVKTLNAINGIF